MKKPLIDEARSHLERTRVLTGAGGYEQKLIARLVDALASELPTESDREALITALIEDSWEGHDEPLDREQLDLIAGTVLDAGFSRAAVAPEGDREALSTELINRLATDAIDYGREEGLTTRGTVEAAVRMGLEAPVARTAATDAAPGELTLKFDGGRCAMISESGQIVGYYPDGAAASQAAAAAKLSHGFLEIEKEEHEETRQRANQAEAELRDLLRVDIPSLKAERDKAAEAIERVRAIHHRRKIWTGSGRFYWGCDFDRGSWPCSTDTALEEAPEPEWEYGIRNTATGVVGYPWTRSEAEELVSNVERDNAALFEVVRRTPEREWQSVNGKTAS